MTASAKPKFYVDIGQTFQVTFRLKDADGDVLDLAGYAARFQARTSPSADGVVFLDFSTDDLTLTITPEAGEISLYIDWAETAGYAPNSGPCELELITPDDERYIILRGIAYIQHGVICDAIPAN